MGNWNLSEGGLSNFEFVVEKAEFGTNAEYNNGNSLLMQWTGTATLEDGEVREDFVLSFPVGNKWLSDDGKTAYHEAGDKATERGFNKSTIFGRVIARAINEFGLGDLLQERGDSTEAKVWEGLKFRVDRETIEFGSGLEPKNRLMPVEYLGIAGEAKATTQTSSPSANPTVVLAKLKKLAKEVSSHEEFVDKAMEIAGVADSDEILSQVVDADAGIYAQANA